MSQPALLKGRRHVKVPVGTVFSILQVIKNHGDAEAFLKEALEKGVTLNVPPAVVNMVKQHLHDRKAHRNDALARSVVATEAASCPDYECPHIVR